jgi:hypothetical protein
VEFADRAFFGPGGIGHKLLGDGLEGHRFLCNRSNVADYTYADLF